MKTRNERIWGFTLVELLIVIALIAILAVGVLATINPVEQRNKATDANTANDAGEVLNAYERFYTNSSNYPWMVTDSTTYSSPNTVYTGVSNQVGFGLCTNVTLGADKARTECSAYNTAGTLINSDELKDSFLEKKYGLISTEPLYNELNKLYTVKTGVAQHNSIYVCYIPKAKSNRTSTSGLKDIHLDANGIPSGVIDNADTSNATYFAADGTINATNWDFLTPAKSLFKCVP